MQSRKIKVLWFSNCILGNKISKGSGSWLFIMKELISDEVDLVNITNYSGSSIKNEKYNNLEEYLLPNFKLYNGVPSKKNIDAIRSIVESIQPDLIHIWGVERYWALLFSRGYIKKDYLLEIQGLSSSCYNVFDGGLSSSEISKCFGIKEFIKPSVSLASQKRAMLKKSMYEKEILEHAKYISTQSEWVRNQIYFFSNPLKVYETAIGMRKEIYNSDKWSLGKKQLPMKLFTTVSYYTPFKGFHMLLKSLSVLKIKYNDVKLLVAGDKIDEGAFYRKDGYKKFLIKLMKKLDLIDNVVFLGRLDAKQIATELKHAQVFINTSFIESYSLGAAEALYLGVPTVLAYSGALPNFSKDKKVALYYPALDYVECAKQIDEILSKDDVAFLLSENAKETMANSIESIKVKQTQLRIYKDYYQHVRNDYN